MSYSREPPSEYNQDTSYNSFRHLPRPSHSSTPRGQGYSVPSGAAYISQPVDYRSRSPSPSGMPSDRGHPYGSSTLYSPYSSSQPQRPLPATPDHGAPMLGVPVPPPHTRHMSHASMPTLNDYDDEPYDQYSNRRDPRSVYPSYAPQTSFTNRHRPQDSLSSETGLTAAAAAPAMASRSNGFHGSRPNSFHGAYPENARGDLGMGFIDPSNIDDDDGDDGFAVQPRDRSRSPFPPPVIAGGGPRRAARDNSGSYSPVAGGSDLEKSTWLKQETTSSKKLKWMVGGLIAVIIVLAIVGGVIGAVITSHKAGSSTSGGASDDDGSDLTKDSPAIQQLMNNPDLHKVFPGMDYTPFNAQYPGCLTNPPSQNNVTKDIAVLSQLTPAIRLYGTDCNQTEMVLHALDVLDLKSAMKVWMGVWIGNNDTTNDRQISQMYKIFDASGDEPFAGVIVGNEVLFRKDMGEAQLGSLLSEIRSNLTSQNIHLPIATSDLGTSWTSGLVAASDIVMSNVHPFFGGVAVDKSASWTYQFWQTHDVKLTSGTNKKQIVSETGWPSSGGNYCTDSEGSNVKCATATAGSVAGVDEMNQFMSDWVCQSLTNGTEYFWFEAFDEPWKVVYNTPDQQWEDKWGLMDAGRTVKPGLKIPDCGGQTATLRR